MRPLLTRYCDASCQLEHWNNGHKKQCKKIARGGGAEQFYADAKYKEAAEAAVLESAPRIPADAICYICRNNASAQALVNDCGCHGGDGIAHLTCLVRMAQTSNEIYDRDYLEGHDKWRACPLCNQFYKGAVYRALGWAMWKTYLARPEMDGYRVAAFGKAAAILSEQKDFPAGLFAQEAHVKLSWQSGYGLLVDEALSALALTYKLLGRHDDALRLFREVYEVRKAEWSPTNPNTIDAGNEITHILLEEAAERDRDVELHLELKRHAREVRAAARSREDIFDHRTVHSIFYLAMALAPKFVDCEEAIREAAEAESILSGLLPKLRTRFGPHHSTTLGAEHFYEQVKNRRGWWDH